MLSLVTLGTLHLTGDATTRLAGRRKVLALLAYLARRAPEPIARQELMALFWADRDETHSKQSLRQALVDLRPALGDALETAADSVMVREKAVALDVTAFEAAVRSEQWSDAARLWKGDFLVATDSLGSRKWEAWLEDQRGTLRGSAARVFEHLAAAAEQRSDWRAMLDAAVRWTEVAPLDERSHRSRIEALVHYGRPIDAAVCYESFLQRLRTARRPMPAADFLELRARFAADGAAVPRRAPGLLTLSTLSQLPLDARAILEAAAVVGEPASETVLRRITELTAPAFRAAMDDLSRRGIFGRHEDADQRYDFLLEGNRKHVDEVIPADRRRVLHRSIFAVLGRVPGAPEPAPVVERRRRSFALRRFVPSQRGLIGISTVVIAAITAVSWNGRTSRADAVELPPGSRILLTDVRNETGEPLLDAALGTAAAVGLKQSRHVALVPAPRHRAATRDSAAAGRDGRRLDVAAARGIAVRDSVARVVSLGVARSDSTYRLAARVIDPQSGDILREEEVEVGRNGLVDGLDDLLQRVRAALGESQSVLRESTRPLRAVASPSLEALEAYTEGARAHAAGSVAVARAAWMRALDADTNFALAELALASDAFERGADREGDRWLARAMAHADRLTTIEAMRARQQAALRGGDLAAARALGAEVVRLEPSSASWFALARTELLGASCQAAAPLLDSALVLDSLHVPSRLALAQCAVARGDSRAAVAHYTTIRRADSGALARPAYAHAWGMLLARAGRLGDAEASFQRSLRAGIAEDTLRGITALAALAMYRGRYAGAQPYLEQLVALHRRGGIAGSRGSAGSPADLRAALLLEAEALIATGARARASERIDEAIALAVADEAAPSEFLHAGRLMARLGRVNGAREALRLLSARVVPGRNEDEWAARLLTAYVHLADREAIEALASIDAATAPRELEPFRLAATADASAMAGQYEVAIAAAQRLADEWHFATVAQDEWLRSSLRLARYAEARGDAARAREGYQRYIDRWKDADTHLIDLATAQRGLVRTGGDSVSAGR